MPQLANIGGQAVIEGVMMRSPLRYAVAVRRPDGSIGVMRREHVAVTARHPLFRLPVVRGIVVLVESLAIGMRALSFAAEETMEPAEREDQRRARAGRGAWRERAAIGATLAVSFVLGLGLFYWLPLEVSRLVTTAAGWESSVAFNLVDGALRVGLLLAYLWLIGRWREIQRVFEYHGAEHKSIFTYERDEPLVPERAARQSRFHPRCGTSFLLLVVLVSVVVFVFLGRPDAIGEKLLRLALVPVIGGISYEILRLGGRHAGSALMRPLVLPGLWLQRITTNEPSHDQLEVALRALEEVLPGAQDAEHRRLAAEI